MEELVPGEGVMCRGAVTFQSSLRSVALSLPWPRAPLLFLPTCVTPVEAASQASTPAQSLASWFFCSKFRREWARGEPSRAQLWVWAANQTPFI